MPGVPEFLPQQAFLGGFAAFADGQRKQRCHGQPNYFSPHLTARRLLPQVLQLDLRPGNGALRAGLASELEYRLCVITLLPRVWVLDGQVTKRLLVLV